jgi:TfoX/Sxy family transcriptional regulator of competence genes
MAYDEQLADRIRGVLGDGPDIAERKMFGGLVFLHRGNMMCGVTGDALMLRLGADRADNALDEPHTRPMDFTGRPMTGIVLVDPAGLDTDEALERWIDRARAFVLTLPPKR